MAATQMHRNNAAALRSISQSTTNPALIVSPDLATGTGSGFTTLFTSWTGPHDEIPAIEVSVGAPDGTWSDWQLLHQDHHVPLDRSQPIHFNPIMRAGTAYRIRTARPEDEQYVVVSELDASSRNPGGLLGAQERDEEIELIDGFIIPRAGWGADESFRHVGQDPSKPIAWPPQYRDIERIIVHHTDTEFGWEDPAAVVRSIYYYHAVLLDWSDIGYNFLIDVYGNVYEGRYGGPGVVGGHALEYNPGSIGIALVGDFEDSWPTEEAIDALVRLIRVRAPNVDPTAARDWIDWGDVPNLCGHGDVINTACPGVDLYTVLPDVRGRLAGSTPVFFPAPIRLYDPKIVSFKVGPSQVGPDDIVEIRATITQDGREPLESQGPDPGFIYGEDDDFDTTGYPKQEGRFRLAVDLVGSDGIPNPFRWGFGGTLQGGEQREIVGYIRMSDMGEKTLVPSIVREFVRYYDEEEISDSIFVVHPLASRAEEQSGPGTVYFEETGHNVPVIFHEYWQAHGGLNRFGFPLTEPFEEKSATDGQKYLTQYFERARFEYHPELAHKNDVVKLGLLGAEATSSRRTEQAFKPVDASKVDPEEQYFPETGHSTSFRFLETWLAEGGVESFRLPGIGEVRGAVADRRRPASRPVLRTRPLRIPSERCLG
ncbi:MAG: N-acetylmuramoyl-L-alanine amidase [Thermomicrobiales bacterium]